MTREARTRVVIGVLTYRRIERLRPLLPLLLAQASDVTATLPGHQVRVVVVDNDPDASARDVVHRLVDEVGAQVLSYHLERVPGISAARNRVLDESHDADVLAFIDDDETPRPGWLVRLLAARVAHQAGVVAGPVVSEHDGPLDPFVEAGGFFDRSHRLGLVTGAPIERAAANNLLLDLATVRAVGARFDPRFGLAGGEDSMFTGVLAHAGVRMVWCAEAVVTDLLPAARMTPAYALERASNLANATVLVELALAGSRAARVRLRAALLARELVRVVHALLLCGSGGITRSLPHRARGRRSLARAGGGLRAVLGHQSFPYGR